MFHSWQLHKEVKKVNKLELNNDATMNIVKRNIIMNNETEYLLKNKIRKFLNYKDKTITLIKLNELILKYLINNKLIIANYFVINDELFNLNECV